MEDSLFLILAAVCSGTHFVRTIYEILKHKNLFTANKLSFVIIFSDMALLWVSWFMICISESDRTVLPGFLNYTGIALIIIGVAAFLSGIFTIKTLESYKGDLITKGIYSKLRHPMYTGFILWICGGALMYGVITAIILAPLFIANVLYWRHLEELELEKRFPEYSEYRKTTLF